MKKSDEKTKRAIKRADSAAFLRGLDRMRGQKVKRPQTTRCRWYGEIVPVKPRGREPRYCSAGCRQRDYEKRTYQPEVPRLLLASDIRRVMEKEAIRQEVIEVLREVGFLGKKTSYEPEGGLLDKSRRSHLKLIPGGLDEDDGDGDRKK